MVVAPTWRRDMSGPFDQTFTKMVTTWFDQNPRLAIIDVLCDSKYWTFLRGIHDGIERQPDVCQDDDEWLRYQDDNYKTRLYPHLIEV